MQGIFQIDILIQLLVRITENTSKGILINHK
jgi:hypothetical protein